MNNKIPYSTKINENLNNNESKNKDSIFSKEIICKGLLNEFLLCLSENAYNNYHPKCIEINKIIKNLKCKK